ncbi:hypothetical protein AB0I84_33835 [Streptomyces spectabilis]|uniref:hypothetical protein n=1 Tax=Streptomyces spectabilis TaxID=68270 RepID=UPI0033CC862C
MLVHEAQFTLDLGESGYLIGFTEHDDYPDDMPYGWRCGPAGATSAIVLPTTEDGPLHLTLQIHDSQPVPEPDAAWETAEELSLLDTGTPLHLATLDPGDVTDAWPEDLPAPRLPASHDGWTRMRLYCHADHPDPGVGDHTERHLIQLWRAPATDPVHPALTADDRQARADYRAARTGPVQQYTLDFPL